MTDDRRVIKVFGAVKKKVLGRENKRLEEETEEVKQNGF